ncbi:ABC transporter ATP-binding protein [Falsiroseomonas sp. E2-1-a20]|uniref:ABC transporter ATP-binding protein n=1 Tax=Falsiroseomonas sp. E2-1-a20 TaxID=3239300 RepID=UPI003F2CFF5C
MPPILDIRGLTTAFPGETGRQVLVDDVSLQVSPGEILAVVGESGSGKTMTFLSALGLVPRPGRVVGGQALLDGEDLLRLQPEALRRARGARIAMVFQDPLTGLNPVFPVGEQIIEVLRAHLPIGRREARARAIALLGRVQIPDASQRVDDYPHQFSGGMRQRVLIAMAIALGPKVLICDEPTTALDVTVQAQVLELLAELRRETGMAMVLVTHDLGVVARHADRIAVMYAGRVVETGAIDTVFAHTRHPYTASLFRSVPELDGPAGEALRPIEGQPPDPAARPPGCAFEPRCFVGHGRARCRTERPALVESAACHFSAELETAE